MDADNQEPQAQGVEKREEELKWYYRPWVVILLIFLALGPFGLPLVYYSPRFNKTWKIVLTIITLIYTWYIIVGSIKLSQELAKYLI